MRGEPNVLAAVAGVLTASRAPRTVGFSAWAFTRQIVYRDSPVRPDAAFALPSAQPLASAAQVRYVSP